MRKQLDQTDQTDQITRQTELVPDLQAQKFCCADMVSRSLLVRGAGRCWAEPGCVLEDALRAGVVDELVATDETLLHRHLAPGAKAIREVG